MLLNLAVALIREPAVHVNDVLWKSSFSPNQAEAFVCGCFSMDCFANNLYANDLRCSRHALALLLLLLCIIICSRVFLCVICPLGRLRCTVPRRACPPVCVCACVCVRACACMFMHNMQVWKSLLSCWVTLVPAVEVSAPEAGLGGGFLAAKRYCVLLALRSLASSCLSRISL